MGSTDDAAIGKCFKHRLCTAAPIPSDRYHFEGSLPQYDVVCKERLVRPEDPANASAQLALQVAAQVTVPRRTMFEYRHEEAEV